MEKFGKPFHELMDPQERMSAGGTIGGRTSGPAQVVSTKPQALRCQSFLYCSCPAPPARTLHSPYMRPSRARQPRRALS